MYELISDQIYLIRAEDEARFPYGHSFLIIEEDKTGTIVDTGCGIKILKNLKNKFDINRVINSHTHVDHCSGNWVFADTAKEICVPEEGFLSAGNIMRLSERFTEKGRLAKSWRKFVQEQMHFRDFIPTRAYNESTVFKIGDVTLKPVYTPGHTHDHYCLYESSQKIMFTFDIDFASFGPWYGHRESSISEFKQSIEKIKRFDIETAVSSHKGIIRDNIPERIEEYVSKFEEREKRILSLWEKTHDIKKIVDAAPIYGAYPYGEMLLRFWEKEMIIKHLVEAGIEIETQGTQTKNS
jgi:glyoxylase-like metal-dependent hydrolase (beta-lactamase superfamily II)